MKDIKVTIVWVLLISLTLMMFLLAQNQIKQQTLVIIMLFSAWIKGQLIIDDFMGLRRVALIWRLIISLWLASVLSIILSVYVWAS